MQETLAFIVRVYAVLPSPSPPNPHPKPKPKPKPHPAPHPRPHPRYAVLLSAQAPLLYGIRQVERDSR